MASVQERHGPLALLEVQSSRRRETVVAFLLGCHMGRGLARQNPVQPAQRIRAPQVLARQHRHRGGARSVGLLVLSPRGAVPCGLLGWRARARAATCGPRPPDSQSVILARSRQAATLRATAAPRPASSLWPPVPLHPASLSTRALPGRAAPVFSGPLGAFTRLYRRTALCACPRRGRCHGFCSV